MLHRHILVTARLKLSVGVNGVGVHPSRAWSVTVRLSGAWSVTVRFSGAWSVTMRLSGSWSVNAVTSAF